MRAHAMQLKRIISQKLGFNTLQITYCFPMTSFIHTEHNEI